MATIKLYINTDRGDISRAFVKSTSEPTANALPPDLVAGNKRNVEVYLIDSAGNYDARSGASNYALSIGAGPLAGTPSSGTFNLTDGTSTTTAIAFNAGAEAVEDALNALNSGAGPHSQLVDVTSTYDGNYRVKFRTTGAVANLSGDASELSPASAVVIDEAVAGDGSTKEQQYIRLLRQPAIFQDSFTQIANGWSGELSANNARVLELMAGRDTIAIPLDVELTETGNEPETIARGNMLLSNEVINPASIDPANLAQLLTEALGDARYLRKANNLSDVTNAVTARSNIGAAAAADVSNVDNTSDADKPVSTAQQTALDLKADNADLTAHTGNTSNPHSVTAAQVGLGNVDNTSDADKPVSTAQQTALDLKADSTALTTETNARVDADNRREFAGGVRFEDVSGASIVLGSSTDFKLDGEVLSFSFNFVGATMRFGKGGNLSGWLASISPVGSVFIMRQAGSISDYYRISFDDIPEGSVVLIIDCTDIANPVIELIVNGSVIGSTVTTAQTGVYGDATALLNFGQYGNLGFYSSASLGKLAIFNTALTATQASELYQQGMQPWLAANPEYRRGREVYVSDFSSNTDGFGNPNGGTLSGNIDNIGNENNALSFTVDNTYTQHRFHKANIFETGKTYRIKLKVYNPSSNSLIQYIKIYSGNNESNSGYINLQSNTWQQIDYISANPHITLSNRLYIDVDVDNVGTADFTGNGTDVIYIKDVEVTQLGSLATLPLDDDCRQLKDISGNRNDATASESGITHLKQKDQHSFRDDNADGTGGSYLIANADILAENEVITGVTVDGRFYAASGAQDLTKRRIKLQDHGSHVDVKRSNGTTDDAAIAVTNPSDGTDFAISVLTQRI